MKLKFYGYDKCGTCRKAKKYLTENNIDFQDVPIRETPPTKEELQFMLDQVDGDIKKLFNTSGKDYKEGNYKDKIKEMTNDQAIEALSQNGNLIKRPFVIADSKGSVGFKEEQWDELYK